MIEITNGAIFTGFLKPESDFSSLLNIFPDGIPIFNPQKLTDSKSFEVVYAWQIIEADLSEKDREYLYQFYITYTGLPISKIMLMPLMIFDDRLESVIDDSLKKTNVVWEHLRIRTSSLISSNYEEIYLKLDRKTLHLVNLCFCYLISECLLSRQLCTELNPLMNLMFNIVTERIPEADILYDVLRSPDMEQAINDLS